MLRRFSHILRKEATWTRALGPIFLIWFCPLACGEDIYQTNESAPPVGSGKGFTIDMIIDICAQSHFHGFLDSTEAQQLLKNKPDGSYLMRFSTTNPGCYALSVSYSGTVGHWRISCDKKFDTNEPPSYKIDGREYRSLDHIISTHKFGREPLKIKQPKPGTSPVCFLGSPLARAEEGSGDSNFYQNVKKI